MAKTGARWGVGIAICLFTASAAADEPPPPPTAPPSAQPSSDAAPSNAARADALFQEGKTLFEAQKYAEACGRFAESDALDPTVSALGLLADCHEKQGKLVAAWKEFQETERRAGAAGDTRAAFAHDRAVALDARVPRITVRLARPVPGIEILRNANRLPPQEIGVEVPVDPGAFEIVAHAPDRREFHATIAVKEGAREVVLVPDLELIPPPQPTPQQPALAKPVTPPAASNARLAGALIAGGIGLTGIGVGFALGAAASSQNTDSKALYAVCSSTGQGCAEGRKARANALGMATGSTVAFGAGIGGIAISAVLLLLPRRAPDPKQRDAAGFQVTPVVTQSGGGAAFAGRF